RAPGDDGAGKELAARAITQPGRPADKPFLAINCGAIPETLLESELFGHERGAFTGAERRRIGKFEQCSGGTLFLDEIGELPPAAQVKLLRVLQEQRFERLGGTDPGQADVRAIAPTTAELGRVVEAGDFRKALYCRLTVFSIRLPPLRERGEDIELLAHHYLARFSREFGKTTPVVPPEALAELRVNPWPGNVRELQSVLKTGLLQMSGAVLLPEFLPLSARPAAAPAGAAPAADRPPLDWAGFATGRPSARG